jgi:membrane protein
LIRAGVLSLAGRNGDQLVPGRALDLITVEMVLKVVRRDEDRVVDRLPANALPTQLVDVSYGRDDVSFADLLGRPADSEMD